MKNFVSKLTPVLASLLFVTAGAPWLNAQIANPIRAHIGHSFVISNKTLPPGEYTFRIEGKTDNGVMTVQNQKGDILAQFNVRQSLGNQRPKHSELVFERYGDAEFLNKVYEGGSKSGVAITETSKEEARMVSEGQHGIEHTEEQE